MTDQQLLWWGEWAKNLVLHVGGSPETAYKVAAAWVEGLRRETDATPQATGDV